MTLKQLTRSKLKKAILAICKVYIYRGVGTTQDVVHGGTQDSDLLDYILQSLFPALTEEGLHPILCTRVEVRALISGQSLRCPTHTAITSHCLAACPKHRHMLEATMHLTL